MDEAKATIDSIVERLREFASNARSSTTYRDIEVEDDNYEFDLGQFGYASTSVRVEARDYELDTEELLEDLPITVAGFDDLADELEAIEFPKDTPAGDLDSVLLSLESNGEGPLARAIRAVVEVFKSAGQQVRVITDLSIGALPAKPLPWPGALRSDVDYTAEDFPLRYNPPPGFAWAGVASQGTGVLKAPKDAEAFDTPVGERKMILDKRGCVSWIARGADDVASGRRWSVWFVEYLDIPRSSGNFTTDTLPLALGADGEVIDTWIDSNGLSSDTTYAPWKSQADKDKALAQVKKIREEYEKSYVPVNNAANGVPYDPLTVELEVETKGGIASDDLRLGEDITGPEFGRVTSVTQQADGRYFIRMNRNGTENTYTGKSTWTVLCLPNRENYPTALSLSTTNGDTSSQVSYDPKTVPLKTDSIYDRQDTLRLGDLITGPGFGRVIKIEDGKLFLELDGKERTINYSPAGRYYYKPIDLPNRESIPTAAQLIAAA